MKQILSGGIALCLVVVAAVGAQAQTVEEVKVIERKPGVIEWYTQNLGEFCFANSSHPVCVALNEAGSLGIGMPAYGSDSRPCSETPKDPTCRCYGNHFTMKVMDLTSGEFQCVRPPLHCTDGKVEINRDCVCPQGTYWVYGGQCTPLPPAPSCACGSAVQLEEVSQGDSPWLCKPVVWCHFQEGVNFVAPAACTATVSGMAGVICAGAAAGGAATAIPSGGTSVLVTGAVCSATFAAFVELSGVCDGIRVFE